MLRQSLSLTSNLIFSVNSACLFRLSFANSSIRSKNYIKEMEEHYISNREIVYAHFQANLCPNLEVLGYLWQSFVSEPSFV